MPSRLLAVAACALLVPAARAQKPPEKIDKAELRALLEKVREKHDVPALAAAVVTDKGVVQLAVVGVRKRGEKELARQDDLFHLGSCTKPLTATLVAVLVEKKRLSYKQTFAESFPELAEKMPRPFAGVTLGQCLTHKAGLLGNLRWDRIPREGGAIAQREEVVRQLAASDHPAAPGEKFLYSNAGYVAAAAMAERATKKTYEELLAEHVTGPLKMARVGYGPMGTPGKLDQPRQHDAKGEPVEPNPFADNPPVMGPSGRMHASLGDWAKFVADQLAGPGGKGALLTPAGYEALLGPAAEGGTCVRGGWGRTGTHEVVLTHDGSNTMNYSSALLVPQTKAAVLVVCNQGPPRGEAAAREAREAIARRWLR